MTWERDLEGAGFHNGYYFLDGYMEAKEDFAQRAGLVAPHRLFSNEQLTEIYRCIKEGAEQDFELSQEGRHLLDSVLSQIETAIPDIQEQSAEPPEQCSQMNL